MNRRFQSLWESLHTSFWFLPTLMAAVAIGLAYGIVRLDRSVSWDGRAIRAFFYPGGPEGARLVLSTIAGSTITVAGVTFSITIAALTMASSQFGPRMLRSFLADKGNQIVLGTFVATFIYCLLVLRTIRDVDIGTFVPEIAVTFGLALALVSFGVLIYFFHHASSSIQAEQVVETVYSELVDAMHATFPEKQESIPGPSPESSPPGPGDESAVVPALTSGYLKAVDDRGLVSVAVEQDLIVRLQYRPGQFVFEQTPLATVTGQRRANTDVHRKIRKACVTGAYRSLEQDVEFPIQQLVDMALRALSPSLNDPYTAVNCIDRLGAAICRLNSLEPARSHHYDRQGNLRLVRPVPTYESVLDSAFGPIRRGAARNFTAAVRLLEALSGIAVTSRSERQREALRRHVEMVHHLCREASAEPRDRDLMESRYQAVIRALDKRME